MLILNYIMTYWRPALLQEHETWKRLHQPVDWNGDEFSEVGTPRVKTLNICVDDEFKSIG